MRFAVIGGAGFIGSHLTKRLLRDGHSVLVIDNLHTGKKENLEGLENVEFHEISIRDYDGLAKVLKGIDGIFHQAALISVQESFKIPEEYYYVNVVGTANVFKIARRLGVKVVYASSSSVYGKIVEIPIKEETCRNPTNPYGKTKLECEELAEKYFKEGLSVIGLRYFNVYGAGQNIAHAGIITKFLEVLKEKRPPMIYGDGEQTRDFIYIDDVVEANIQAMLSDVKTGVFNIGTGTATSIFDLTMLVGELSKNALHPLYQEGLEGDVRVSVADCSKSLEVLGWKSKVRLRDGLSILVE